MRLSEYLILNEDDLAARRVAKQQQQSQQQSMEQDDHVDVIIDRLDHAFAQALDDLSELLGDDVKALEMISNHVAVFYDTDVQQ